MTDVNAKNTNAEKAAFPHEDFEYDGGDQYKVIHSGLTKREYFAAMALQGLLSNTGYVERLNPDKYDANKLLVMESVDMADELLKALNQPQ